MHKFYRKECVIHMQRRKCKLSVSEYSNIDLREYEKVIVQTINATVKGKNPKVFKNYFSTDVLTQSEAVSLGRALAKIDELKIYGKTVTTFRLFDGKTYDSEEAVLPVKKQRFIEGGRKNRDYKKIH